MLSPLEWSLVHILADNWELTQVSALTHWSVAIDRIYLKGFYETKLCTYIEVGIKDSNKCYRMFYRVKENLKWIYDNAFMVRKQYVPEDRAQVKVSDQT